MIKGIKMKTLNDHYQQYLKHNNQKHSINIYNNWLSYFMEYFGCTEHELLDKLNIDERIDNNGIVN